MSTLTLTILTGLELSVFLLALAFALVLIRHELESVAQTLDKIAWGVRAVETLTSALKPEVAKLNAGLSALPEGLKQVFIHFAAADENLKKVAGILGKSNA
jgi:hypothetical protein